MIQKPKGTKDLLPEDSYKWQFVERKIAKVLENYGFKEIRVPVFEYTELFQRGVGETTDVVQKEMYTFDDKGGRSITLRPEGTAGAVRAYLENGMASKPSPVKLYYNMAMYRYENVQKGRLREFHQIGAELIGSSSYLADVDTILMAKSIFDTLNIPNIKLNINSIGCPKCRSEYQKKLREFIGKNLDSYCDTCKTRFEKNPMRILDCKEKKCKELNVGAPMMIDYLCEECKEHFENVKSALSSANVEFEIDSSIVRGLDYYTKTVFEFIDDKTGLTVLGGGRYDGLVEEFGGASTPAVGFATGVERVMELFEATNEQVQENVPDLYIVSCGDKENIKSIEIAENLRKAGVYVEKDIMERSFKAQFKYADKLNCKNVIVIGEDELTSGKVKVKNMATGEEVEAELAPEAIINI
ncbi:MAG: histidine--tRNA ligase, partial [Clostridia bacterium]